MKIYSEKHPQGCEIAREARVDDKRWIDYMEWQGQLSDGSQYILKGTCDYRGWRYVLFIEGERTALLNDRSPSGKPSAM